PWLHVERAAILEREDRIEEALAASRRALELRPWYSPGVQTTADLLLQLGRDLEAFDLLTEAAGRLESVGVVLQLSSLAGALGGQDEARRWHQRALELSVLRDEPFAAWLTHRESYMAYRSGNLQLAAELGQRSQQGRFGRFFEKFSAAPRAEGKRVEMPVA